eukprot:scaffold10861_cov180-Amphora_coffeaeformis.AAC.17
MSSEEAKTEPTRDFSEQEAIVDTLHRIEASLKAMSTVPTVPLSHYRVLPDATKEAYEIMQQGAALVHGTSTKYTLLGKLDTVEQTKMSKDLQQGCELIATACLVLHEKSTGSSLSLRKHAVQASRAIVVTTIQLLEAYTHGDALHSQQDLGAQKTGAVWQTCSVVLDKKLPMGNRNAMRRDLLTYTSECQETLDEFQELLDKGPASSMDAIPESQVEDSWEIFLGGQSEQYGTPKELAVGQAAFSILKISRGTVKLSLQACDAVGEQLKESSSDEERTCLVERQARLEWMRLLHEECCLVGEGVTDLGTTLYPPLKLSDVTAQLSLQMRRIEKVLDHVHAASIVVHDRETDSNRTISLDFHIDVSTMAGKLKGAMNKRKEEVLAALLAVGCSFAED